MAGSRDRVELRRTEERITGTPSVWYEAGNGAKGFTTITTVGPFTRSK
jgi:hypothetical protein